MYLYKYVPSQRIDILRKERIRITPPSGLNDPFDLRPYFEVVVQDEELLDSLADRELDLTPGITAGLIQAYREHPELQSVSEEQFLEKARNLLASSEVQQQLGQQISPFVAQLLTQVLTTLREQAPKFRKAVYDQMSRMGIVSLSETATNSVMWAHYAEDHKGFVLELDGLHPALNRRRSTSDEFFYPRKVLYREPRQGVAFVNLRAEEVFLLKAPSWSYEKEWRILVPLEAADISEHGDGDLHFLRLPAPVLTTIAVGARASPTLREDVIRLKQEDPRYHHLDLREAQMDNSRAAIVVRSLS